MYLARMCRADNGVLAPCDEKGLRAPLGDAEGTARLVEKKVGPAWGLERRLVEVGEVKSIAVTFYQRADRLRDETQDK